MARSLNGTTDRLGMDVVPLTGYPFTLMCRFKATAFPSPGNFCNFITFTPTTVTTNNYIAMYCDGTNGIGIFINNGGSTNHTLAPMSDFVTGRWYTLLVSVLDSTSAFNTHVHSYDMTTGAALGLQQGGNSLAFPAGIGRMTAGAIWYNGSYIQFFNGLLADLAIWSKELGYNVTTPFTDDEISALGHGASPLTVAPQALVFYAPVLGQLSPEPDLMSAHALTLTGTADALAHPPIAGPARPLMTFKTPVVAAGPVFRRSLMHRCGSRGRRMYTRGM